MSNYTDTPGLVGLQNLGNTCYMNSALQALSNCQQLTRFVLDCPAFPRDKGLCRSYSELMKEIWNSGGSQYAVPAGIMRNIKCIYPAFRGCSQQDTQEFLRCFLEQLHDELKAQSTKQQAKQQHRQQHQQQATANIRRQSITKSEEGDLRQAKEEEEKEDVVDAMEEKEKEEDEEEDKENLDKKDSSDSDEKTPQRSIISDTFEFNISSSVVCSSCNNISTTKETFKDLSIPIPSRDHPYYRSNTEDEFSITSEHSDTTSRKKATSKKVTSATNSKTTSSESLNKLNDDDGSPSEENDDEDKSPSDISDNKVENQIEVQRSFIASLPLARWLWDWLSYFSSWFWGPQVTLQDCLSIFFGSDPLEGDNEYSCEKCTKKNRGIKYLKIIDLPEVLCVHLKRYESVGSTKINTHVTFPLTGLDLAPFMSETSEVKNTTYDLIACICHHGSALQTGHYTTYALNHYDEQWYEFDDQYVTNVQEYQVENSEAYILFYQKSPTTRED